MSVPLHSFLRDILVTGATFTDPLTCSFLILSFFVTPHIHLIIIISFISSIFSWLFFIDHVSAPYSHGHSSLHDLGQDPHKDKDVGHTTVLCIFPFSFTGIFLSHNTPLHLFELLQAAFVLSPYPHLLSFQYTKIYIIVFDLPVSRFARVCGFRV